MLSKGDVKSKKIRVEFSLEDMDTDGFKKGATYNARTITSLSLPTVSSPGVRKRRLRR